MVVVWKRILALFAALFLQGGRSLLCDTSPGITEWNTTSIIKGRSSAGFVCTGKSNIPRQLFYWKASGSSSFTRGLLIFLAGGPGIASTPYLFSLGPSKVTKDSKLDLNSNPWANSLPDFDIIFIDAPAGVGFSPAFGLEHIGDRDYANAVADSVLQLVHAGAYDSTDVVLIGESYGSKFVALVADQILSIRPSFPLRAICLSAALLDRVAEAYDWIDAYARLLGSEAKVALQKAGLGMMQERLDNLGRDRRSLKEADKLIDEMWDATMNATGVRNQHDLSPRYRNLPDSKGAFADYFSAGEWLKTQGRDLLAKAGKDVSLPEFVTSSGDVFNGFANDRLRDATPSLAALIGKGVMVLVVTGEWDGMCTVEGTTHWLKNRFAGVFQELSTEHCARPMEELPSNLRQQLLAAQFAHVEVQGSGHMVSFDCPVTLGKLLHFFLSGRETENNSASIGVMLNRVDDTLAVGTVCAIVFLSFSLAIVRITKCRGLGQRDSPSPRAYIDLSSH